MEKENLMEKQTTNKRCLLFGLETRELEIDGEEKKELWVEGRAVSFNSPTVLFEIGETQYKEQIDSRAFEETNLSDVIFNYNHGGNAGCGCERRWRLYPCEIGRHGGRQKII